MRFLGVFFDAEGGSEWVDGGFEEDDVAFVEAFRGAVER